MKGRWSHRIAFLFLGLGGVAGCSPMAFGAGVSKPEAPAPEFTGDQAWEAFRKDALFLDARQPADYAQGHIPRALNLSLRAVDFEDRLRAFLAGPKEMRTNSVVVYCSGCCSTDSLFLAQQLKDVGFTQIHIYRDGFPGWLRAGHSHAVGDSPDSMEVK
jgi:rhodanese-related sulfurtransferase